MNDEPLATISASAPRRFVGVAMLTGLGLLLPYLAMQGDQGAFLSLFLIVLGGGAMWVALRMLQATKQNVILTVEGLYDSDGTLIAALDNITRVEKGAFAFKPSNGFTLRTQKAGTRAWRPGMWWRLGKSVGIGGVTPGQHGKTMADILAALIADKTMIDDIKDRLDQQ